MATYAHGKELTYTCPTCGTVSHNVFDAIFKYCGECCKYEATSPMPDVYLKGQFTTIIDEFAEEEERPDTIL